MLCGIPPAGYISVDLGFLACPMGQQSLFVDEPLRNSVIN